MCPFAQRRPALSHGCKHSSPPCKVPGGTNDCIQQRHGIDSKPAQIAARRWPDRRSGAQRADCVTRRTWLPRFSNYPFSLGVASGDPVSDGFVLWTRLAPDPLNGGGMPPEAVPVRWEVAQDERFRSLLRQGETLASPERAHAVHVDVQGLQPDRWYYYRFLAGGEVSPTGRTRTFPPWGPPKTVFVSHSRPVSILGKAFLRLTTP